VEFNKSYGSSARLVAQRYSTSVLERTRDWQFNKFRKSLPADLACEDGRQAKSAGFGVDLEI
jgi:hypothetical protein